MIPIKVYNIVNISINTYLKILKTLGYQLLTFNSSCFLLFNYFKTPVISNFNKLYLKISISYIQWLN